MFSLRTIFFVSVVFALLLTTSLFAAAPQLINYQARLTDNVGNPVADGSYSVVFTIYDAATVGNSKWTETQSVSTVDGQFLVLLGSVSAIEDTVFNEPFRYLGIKVGGDPEMTPRTVLVTVPWSFGVSTVDGSSGGTISGDLEITGKATIGQSQTNTGLSAFVAGEGNSVTGRWSSVSGGAVSQANGDWSTVSGGQLNNASSDYATVGGGSNNSADGYLSTVGGGTANQASDTSSIVSGGRQNIASGTYSAVGGGFTNTASGKYAIIAGGSNNFATGQWSTVSGGDGNNSHHYMGTIGGGFGNFASDTAATVSGGMNNRARKPYSTVSGGGGPNASDSNSASGFWSTISGGIRNNAVDTFTTVSGGRDNAASAMGATISGGSNNHASGQLATVGGGILDSASGTVATIAGGFLNKATGSYSAIGGGLGNTASDTSAIVGGGKFNSAEGRYSTVGGGMYNEATGNLSFVGGGYSNKASSYHSTVPGGYGNSANGANSFAAGYMAKANHDGAIVISANKFNFSPFSVDSISSGGDEQIVLRADGGMYITNTLVWTPYDPSRLINTSSGAYLTTGGVWTNSSDKNSKENFESVNCEAILEKISNLPISEWNYKEDDETIKHIGPVAQDFHQIFGLGSDDKSISTIDPSGIALAAIKELNEQNKKLKVLVTQLQERLTNLENDK